MQVSKSFTASSRAVTICMALVLCAATRARAQEVDNRPDITIDATMRNSALLELAAQIDSTYPVADAAARTSQTLRRSLKSGKYTQTSGRAFAAALTADLRAMMHDQHFLVDYFVLARPFPPVAASGQTSDDADRRLMSALHNYGFSKVERLAGNVGYIRLDRFESPEIAGSTAAAAMQFVSTTDALVIDLRGNGGGDGEMVAMLATYLFPDRVHLGDVMTRSAADFKQNWTLAFVPGERYLDKPVYVLTAARTFSAAEALAYDLQALRRATIIGENTRGGANPSTRVLLSSRFAAIIPVARARNAITGTNWDGVGVKPDVAASADSAMNVAYAEALRKIAPKHKDDPLTQEIAKALAALGK